MGVFTEAARKKAIETRRRNAILRKEGKLAPVQKKKFDKAGHTGVNDAALSLEKKLAPLNGSEIPFFDIKDQAVGVTPAFEVVTPSKAEKWLNFNTNNRALTPGLAEKYAKDMKEGRWTTCIDPITFYADGSLANGQHRLFAVVESDCPQRFLILRGLDRPSGLNIDMQKGRTLVNNADIAGIDHDLSNVLIALCRGIQQGNRQSDYITNSEKLHWVAAHREAARFAMQHGGKGRGFSAASINSAIARAWYYEADKERLMQFGTVLSKGFGEGDGDTAAIAMRNYLQSQGSSAVSSSEWRDVFVKVQNAVWYFMRKRRLMMIRGLSDERYPLRSK